MENYTQATQCGINGPETATHKGRSTGNLYRCPGSCAAVKWLVFREGELMRGWVGVNFEIEEDLLELQ